MALNFSTISPWQDIVRCNVSAGGNVSNVGNATLNNEDLRVMVRIPAFFVKAENIAGSYRWFISSTNKSGYEIHPAFKQRTASSPYADYIYVGAYEAGEHTGDGSLISKSGVAPHVNVTIGAMKELAYDINNGDHWGITNVWTRNAIELLFMIEYGNMDSQSNIGDGITGVGSASNTGADNIENNLNAEGTGTGDADDDTSPVCYRWMENLWGNVWEFIDGIEISATDDDKYRILKSDGTWDETGPSDQAGVVPYTNWDSNDYDLGPVASLIDNDGYISDVEYDNVMKYLMFPSAVSGSSSTYIPDKIWSHDNGENNIVLAGGAWNDGANAGLACRTATYVRSNTNASVGCRLEFIA